MMFPRDVSHRMCSGATDVVIAAPYIKAAALDRFLNQLSPSPSLVCVTRWTPRDLAVGASDLECRALVTDLGGEFRLHPTLHAKYYRCGQERLVGSANLTMRGMGYAAVGNLEILCEPAASFDAVAFERSLVNGSYVVGEAEFEQWASIARLPAVSSAWPHSVPPIEDWKPSARDPRNVWLAYCGVLDQIPSEDERRLAQSDLDHLALPADLPRPAFNAWVGAQLLAAPAVLAVKNTMDDSDPVAWARLAVEWDMDLHTVARVRQTVIHWLVVFRPEPPPHVSHARA